MLCHVLHSAVKQLHQLVTQQELLKVASDYHLQYEEVYPFFTRQDTLHREISFKIKFTITK